MHSSLDLKNTTYGPPLDKSENLESRMEYMLKEEVLKDKNATQNRKKKYKGDCLKI